MSDNPFDLRELPEAVYSNCDHALDATVADQLKAGDCYAQHAAWDFCAYVWFENGRYRSYVMRYGSHRATLENDDLADLIRQTNDEFGHG
jgi:hypothetical protein